MIFTTTGSTRVPDRGQRGRHRGVEQISAHSGSRTQELLGGEQLMGVQRSQCLEEAFLWPNAQGMGKGLTTSSGTTGFLVPKRQADAASGKFLGLLRSSKDPEGSKTPCLRRKSAFSFYPSPNSSLPASFTLSQPVASSGDQGGLHLAPVHCL